LNFGAIYRVSRDRLQNVDSNVCIRLSVVFEVRNDCLWDCRSP